MPCPSAFVRSFVVFVWLFVSYVFVLRLAQSCVSCVFVAVLVWKLRTQAACRTLMMEDPTLSNWELCGFVWLLSNLNELMEHDQRVSGVHRSVVPETTALQCLREENCYMW